MPLPRYQPKSSRKIKVRGPSLDDLDDYCLAKIIGHVIRSSKVRQAEPFVGDTGQVERNLSLVSRRWYILTQTIIGSNGCHRIDLDDLFKIKETQASPSSSTTNQFKLNSKDTKPELKSFNGTIVNLNTSTIGKIPTRHNSNSALATGRRLATSGILMPKNYGNISVAPSFFEQPKSAMKVIKQRKMTAASNESADTTLCATSESNDLKIFRTLQPRLLKYKHIQISGSLSSDQFVKLLQLMNAAKVEELDLLDVKLENEPLLENHRLLQRTKRDQRLKLNLYLRDQKYSDPEDKVRYLIQWSRLADLTVHISAIQRITIDCCHLMWSTGRIVQATKGLACNVVFKITLQTYAPGQRSSPSSSNRSVITVPFGKRPRYELSAASNENANRHRDILRAIVKGCYHSFVKCVRDYNSSS